MTVAYKLSVDRYEQMIRAGILTENDPVELIRGELIEKMPIGPSHIAAVNRLSRILNRKLISSAIISIQNPIALEDSEPEPDVALLVMVNDDYEEEKAKARDAFLLIEVSDSTLEFDRTTKLALYAEAGIREYWVVNLLDQQLEVHRQPQSDGTFRDNLILTRGQAVEILAFPGVRFQIAEMLG